jgi:hypothetical protein
MNTPYGLEVIENCGVCKLRRDKWFCRLSPDVLKSFSAPSHLSTYPGGAILFVDGQTLRGALVLCLGKVKLSATSRDDKVLILKMAEPRRGTGSECGHFRDALRTDGGNDGTMPGELHRP